MGLYVDPPEGVTIDIRRRPEGTHWFVPLQPLWRVERTFAWLGRNRRLRYDYEATVTSSERSSTPPPSRSCSTGYTRTDKPFPQLRGLSTGSQGTFTL